MSCLRKLYGYKIKKKKKIYSNEGLISKIGAIKTAANQIMSKIEDVNTILNVLKEFNIPYKVTKIFI